MATLDTAALDTVFVYIVAMASIFHVSIASNFLQHIIYSVATHKCSYNLLEKSSAEAHLVHHNLQAIL